MIDPRHLLEHVIRPVLRDLGLWSVAAERLVLGTACQESACGRYLVQIGGPAKGIFQMEPATHDDIWGNFLVYRDDLQVKILKWRTDSEVISSVNEMIGNLYYATAMCRVHYLRVPEPIPDDLHGQAQYWKKNYNSELGKGTVEEYMNNWNRFVSPQVLA